MSTSFNGIIGKAPQVRISSDRPLEKDLYRMMWERPEYRKVAPGEGAAFEFLAQAKPPRGASVIDLGCGTGRGALNLAFFGGLDVTMVDFADNCLDPDIRPMLETQSHVMRFKEHDLSQPLEIKAAYGFCTDVMEHIRPHHVDRVLDNCLAACHHVFFQISTEDDQMGKLLGHKLHLSVHSYDWWLKKFNDRNCLIHWSKEESGYAYFYVSAWASGNEIVDCGVLNTSEEKIKEQVKHNISLGFQQVQPYPTNNVEVMIVGGGPSLANSIEEIRKLREDGVKLITINNAYRYCIDNGITPSAMVMVDAQEHNNRFVDPIVPDCKYFIASQCHPSVFAKMPKEQTYIWHTSTEILNEILASQYERWYPVPGGSTVLLRTIPLFRMLGFKRFHVFGCDSCLDGDKHHAYEQKENDGQPVVPVNVGGKIFYCNPWMISQAQEFIDLIKMLGDEIELDIRGGLLRHILETGASCADLKEI
jgi:2-polyprenyl-3-methyl-5-hydroxy-6-metoxy-1,4-benzoquinol methylase